MDSLLGYLVDIDFEGGLVIVNFDLNYDFNKRE